MITQVQDSGSDIEGEEHHKVLLHQIRSLCDLSQEKSSEEELLSEVLKLADEIAVAQLSQSTDWSNRLRSLVDTTIESEQNENQECHSLESSHQEISAQFLSEAYFECNGIEAIDQVIPLVSLILMVEKNTYQQADEDQRIYSPALLSS